MDYIHALAAGHLQWALYTIPLLASALPDKILSILMRGFGRRGFGFGRGRGIFRIFRLVRILFVLLFTSVLGPIVLVALIAFAAYAFFSSRRGR
jgi:hypothetical protein